MMTVIDRQGHDAYLENVLIVSNGRLVFEEYFGDSHRHTLSYPQSATKSVVATIFGIAVDNGFVASEHPGAN
ncbi:MAG TPA: hypothetical protein VIS31_13940 [Woeseiaceae bacterium]|nr:hypothetical protein [Woeseiaceae bacterium]